MIKIGTVALALVNLSSKCSAFAANSYNLSHQVIGTRFRKYPTNLLAFGEKASIDCEMICPEIPTTPQTPTNEVAVLASG
ncbi:hypothetical protein ACHAXS_006883 [Conticribra weissflogii]